MPFNGSGTFVPLSPPNYPAVSGATISSAAFNNWSADVMSNGLSLCLPRDGQSAMTGNLNLGGFRILAVAAPVAGGDAATKDYVDTNTLLKSGGVMTGALTFGANSSVAGFKLTNLGTPTDGGDAVNKTYADGKLALTGGSLSGNLSVTGTVTATSSMTATQFNGPATSVGTTNYTIDQSGGNLRIRHGSTTIFRIDSSGNVIALGNVTAFGAP